MSNYIIKNGELYHWGIKGMKWGRRRYQNEDGSLTDAGKRRYNSGTFTADPTPEWLKKEKERRGINPKTKTPKFGTIDRPDMENKPPFGARGIIGNNKPKPPIGAKTDGYEEHKPPVWSKVDGPQPKNDRETDPYKTIKKIFGNKSKKDKAAKKGEKTVKRIIDILSSATRPTH